MHKTFGINTKCSPLTSFVLQFRHIGNGFSHIFLCCLGERVPPGDNVTIKQDESKVVFLVEVFQNGLQCIPGLQKFPNSHMKMKIQ